MKYTSTLLIAIFVLSFSTAGLQAQEQSTTEKTRLIIMADMGNESDEEQQIVHMLMYSNMFDLEGLIACSGLYLHTDVKDKFRTKVHPELFTKLINGYEKVAPNLEKHASGWPSPDYLHSIVRSGSSVFGMAAVGEGMSNEASTFLEAAMVRNDPRKLYIVANAGTNSLAQALIDLDTKFSDEKMKAICEKIIVFENGAQDNAGAWIASKFPHIAWHRSNRQTYCYGGPDNGDFGSSLGPYTWKPYKRDSDGQDEWAAEHIRTDHGALGALFPYRNRFIEGGGTIPWMGLAFHGLSDPERLYWGGQSGRFSREKHKNVRSRHPVIRKDEMAYGGFSMFESDSEKETWTEPLEGKEYSGKEVPVWRFRRSMFNDFRARMDWCVKDFAEANHNPVAAFNGDTSDTIIELDAKPGETLTLDASKSSDPDGDELSIKWWVYQEAGTYEKLIAIADATSARTILEIPADAAGKEIHVILEVRDKSKIIPMYDFRRVVIRPDDEQ